MDIAHVSNTYVHAYEHASVVNIRQCTTTTRNLHQML